MNAAEEVYNVGIAQRYEGFIAFDAPSIRKALLIALDRVLTMHLPPLQAAFDTADYPAIWSALGCQIDATP